ncbi:MAG: VWA domain-containing protein [Campylobacterales bacterium]|nr:VWA domain-containing protein [Campylobacterales bacterium]
MVEFEYPLVFLAIILFIICSFFCKYRPFSLYFPHIDLLRDVSKKAIKVEALLKWLIILGTLTALASPVIINKRYQQNNIGYDIIMAIDASGSMDRAFNMTSRYRKFDVTKKIVGDFILKREHDNMGVVAFGEYGFIVSPLSYDKKLTLSMLENVNMDRRFSNGTAIGDAIAQGVRALKSGIAKSKMIILVTDGNEEGQVTISYDKATKIAKDEKVKVYTIGIGRDFNRNVLKHISKETNGEFFSADDPKKLLEIYETIDRQEKSEIKTKGFEDKRYYYHYPLFVAIISLILFILVRLRQQ